MKTLMNYRKIENSKIFMNERNTIKNALNMQILEIHKKIELEAEINNKTVLYSIPVNSIVFSRDEDRKGYINKTSSGFGPFQIFRLDVIYYEYLHNKGKSENGIYFYFNLNMIDGYSSDVRIMKEDSHFIEIPLDYLRFSDDEASIYYYRKNIYFLLKKDYYFYKKIILEVYSDLELNQNNNS